jgi:hypothetical protein
MQIFEITQPGSGQAGVFGRALGSALAQRVMPGINVGDADGGPAAADRMTAAMQQSEPLVRQQAEQQMKAWNASVRELMQQADVLRPDQLPGQQKQILARNLLDIVNKGLGGRLDNFKNLSTWVDQKSQTQARDTVTAIERSIAQILNWRNPARDSSAQMQQWQDLMKSVYTASALMRFRPATSQAKASTAPMPAITLAPNGNYRIGRFQINPAANPLMKALGSIVLDQTQQVPGQQVSTPKISITPTGEYVIGDYVLDQNEPAEALAIQIIKSERAGGTV